jgi:hypothetical protein
MHDDQGMDAGRDGRMVGEDGKRRSGGTDFGSRPRPFPFADATCKPLVAIRVFN